MKKYIRILSLFIAGQILMSCTTSLLTVEKRLYKNGYYVQFNNKSNKVKQAQINSENFTTSKQNVKNTQTIEIQQNTEMAETFIASTDNNTVMPIIETTTIEAPNQNQTEMTETSIASTDNNIVIPVIRVNNIKKNNRMAEKQNVQKIVLAKSNIKSKALEHKSTTAGNGSKSQLVALLLCLFFGVLGIHRFYLGYTWQGVVQLLTGGGFGIWVLIDFIRIIIGSLQPKNGRYDKTL